MRLAIHQPNLFPRLKVLQKLAAADFWVVLDNVQYCEREWQNRTRIVTVHRNPTSFWLSIPVIQPHGRGSSISEIAVMSPTSTDPLVSSTCRHAFRRAPYWNAIDHYLAQVRSFFEDMSIVGLCVSTTCALLEGAGRKPNVIFASKLPVSGKASALMASICECVHADEYLADSGSLGYLHPPDFRHTAILWQDWREPPSAWPGITSWRNISCLNYMCREGVQAFSDHINSGSFLSAPLVVPDRLVTDVLASDDTL